MPNSCSCRIRIGANKETIGKLCETEFSFEKLYPVPENCDRYEWTWQHWGTKWDRDNYKLKHRGNEGMEISFTTAWNPPFALFQYLVNNYHDVWLKCDWSEEGGLAGVFVCFWNEKEEKVMVESFEWQDWCLEEWHHRMQ